MRRPSTASPSSDLKKAMAAYAKAHAGGALNFVVAGGVAANGAVRAALTYAAAEYGFALFRSEEGDGRLRQGACGRGAEFRGGRRGGGQRRGPGVPDLCGGRVRLRLLPI